MADTDSTRVEHHPDRQRFEILVGAEVAGYAEYRQTDPTVRDFDHTVTLPEFRGRGLAAVLVRHALDDTRAAGLKIVPSCSYVHHFVETHEEYADLTV
ncbi:MULTISPECIES: GNAT family N-acetyltransferase [Nocardiaceae]|uniref:GNAT family acetyltransferase n=1 Tax=Rhodococcoides corynebacterioides TaxID=53972 RepID=A0ABS2KWP4_9NOCA|nr:MULTISPECIES: GNAT family N-acetyltransferase [Rhodococcus]MBM7415696.1 putative GNAT family acetyltransferase [Rhodococcus corynebacterioides]MBP1118158.1 putative GNAT family acetyltransferase [Rhodococcus sp. PvP016]